MTNAHESMPGNGESMNTPTRIEDITRILRNEALIEVGPTLEFLNAENIDNSPGGSIYYGTGLTTPKAASVGLPFDTLGMILSAEKIRRAGNFQNVYHHIADTHAKTNEWIDPTVVDEVAAKTVTTLESIKRNLDLESFNFILSSSFDTEDEYKILVESFSASAEHEYVKREMADIEWYRQKADVRIKMGWIIQAKETEMGFDERRFDREYLSFHPGQMSFVYTKPGRTFDTSRPKASPYISVDGEQRLMLNPGIDVESVFSEVGDVNLGGARKHIQNIVRLYESLYGNLGKIDNDKITLGSKVQFIIDKCFEK